MERGVARNWYLWLWISPLVTVPTLMIIAIIDPGGYWICQAGLRVCDHVMAWRVTFLYAVFGSSLWHLILFIPALNRKSAFVCWHGRQMLLLAGLRTAIPAITLGFIVGDESALLSLPFLIVVWFFGTLWGQMQAGRGDCSLMRWMGQEVLLPSAEMVSEEPATTSESDLLPAARSKNLVNIIRHSPNRKRRRQALSELQQAGLAAAAFGSDMETGQLEELNTEVGHLLEVIHQNPDRALRREALEGLRLRGLVEPL